MSASVHSCDNHYIREAGFQPFGIIMAMTLKIRTTVINANSYMNILFLKVQGRR